MGKALAPGTLEPVMRFGDGLPLFLALRFVVNRRVVESYRNGINNGFKKSDQRGELRLGQAVDQLVCVLTGIAHGVTSVASQN